MKYVLKAAITCIAGSAILISVLTGCSKQKEQNAAAHETRPVLSTASQSAKIAGKETTIKIMRYEHPSQVISDDAPVYKEILKRTNIKIDFEAIPFTNYEDKKKILIATNNIPDIMQINRNDLNDNASSGIFLPLFDYISKYAPNFTEVMDKCTDIRKLVIDDELYCFPMMNRVGPTRAWVPIIRTDLLKKHNLTVPDSFDELYSVLKELKELYPETYPLTNRSGTKFLISTYAYPMGSGFALSNNTGAQFGIYLEKDKGNKYVYGPVTEEFKEVIAFLNKLFMEGLLDPDYAANTQQQWTEKMTSGKSLFTYDTETYSLSFESMLKKNNPEAELKIIPIMKNSKGTRRNSLFPAHSWDDLFAISSKVKHPEIAVKFMDWLYSEEGADLTNFGILNEHYTKNGSEYRILDSVIKKYEAAPAPKSAMEAALGTGIFQLCLYYDISAEQQLDPLRAQVQKLVGNDPAMVPNELEPPFTKNEREKFKDLRTKLENCFNEEIDKFIMGVKPMSEYDSFAAKLKELGALELEDIYNTALERYNNNNKN